eukprot:641281-Prorocentrum_minimum.AAC.2
MWGQIDLSYKTSKSTLKVLSAEYFVSKFDPPPNCTRAIRYNRRHSSNLSFGRIASFGANTGGQPVRSGVVVWPPAAPVRARCCFWFLRGSADGFPILTQSRVSVSPYLRRTICRSHALGAHNGSENERRHQLGGGEGKGEREGARGGGASFAGTSLLSVLGGAVQIE